MFFVYTWNPPKEDFEVIGAFSKEDEAEEFALERKTPAFAPFIRKCEWAAVIDEMTQVRVGAIALEQTAIWPELSLISTLIRQFGDRLLALAGTSPVA